MIFFCVYDHIGFLFYKVSVANYIDYLSDGKLNLQFRNKFNLILMFCTSYVLYSMYANSFSVFCTSGERLVCRIPFFFFFCILAAFSLTKTIWKMFFLSLASGRIYVLTIIYHKYLEEFPGKIICV